MDNFSVNPFFWRRNLTKQDYLSFILILPYLPFKLLFAATSFFLFYISSYIFNKIRELNNPTDYLKVRKYYQTVPRFFMLMFCYSMGFRAQIIGNSNLKENKGKIYIFAPHISVFDAFICWSMGLSCSVSTPLLKGSSIYSAIFVKKNKQETINAIKAAADSGEKIVIFPEGILTNGHSILKFKTGAFEPGLSIQPVFIEYPKGSENATTCVLKPYRSYDFLIFTFLRWKTTVKAHMLPVYYPSDEEIKSPVLYCENVQNYFCDSFGLKKSFYDCDDSDFFIILKNKGIPTSPTCLKLIRVCYKTIAFVQNKTISSLMNQNVDVDRNSNRIDDLDVFLMNLVFSSKAKLDALDNLDLPINSTKSLANLLEIDKKCPEIENSLTLKDFFNSISGHSNKRIYLDLYIILTLCNISIPLKNRIGKCIMKLESIEKDQLKDHVIKYTSFSKIIWHLLGIDESYLPESIFRNQQIKSEFFEKEISKVFSLAVYQNAPDLILIDC